MRRGTAQGRLPAQGHVISGFESSTLANRLETLLVDRLYARPALFHSSTDRPQGRDIATEGACPRVTVSREQESLWGYCSPSRSFRCRGIESAREALDPSLPVSALIRKRSPRSDIGKAGCSGGVFL